MFDKSSDALETNFQNPSTVLLPGNYIFDLIVRPGTCNIRYVCSLFKSHHALVNSIIKHLFYYLVSVLKRSRLIDPLKTSICRHIAATSVSICSS